MEVEVFRQGQETYYDLSHEDNTVLEADFVSHLCFGIIKECIRVVSYGVALINSERQQKYSTSKER